LLASVNDLIARVKIHSVRQAEQRGLGDAVYQARRYVGDQPFVCMLGDAIFSTPASDPAEARLVPLDQLKGQLIGRVLTRMGRLTREQVVDALTIQKRERVRLGELFVRLGHVTPRDIELALAAQSGQLTPDEAGMVTWGPAAPPSPAMLPVAQLVEAYEQVGTAIIGLEKVPADKVGRYGIVGGPCIADGLYKLDTLIEKPSLVSAPSRLAIAARYLLTPAIFECLEQTKPGAGGEVQLTDAPSAPAAARADSRRDPWRDAPRHRQPDRLARNESALRLARSDDMGSAAADAASDARRHARR
jgi:UTP-glucose-1-phosphate uridylyltransferase